MAKMTIYILPQKQGVALLGTRKPTKMTKMAGAPQTKPPFAKSTVFATLTFAHNSSKKPCFPKILGLQNPFRITQENSQEANSLWGVRQHFEGLLFQWASKLLVGKENATLRACSCGGGGFSWGSRHDGKRHLHQDRIYPTPRETEIQTTVLDHCLRPCFEPLRGVFSTHLEDGDCTSLCSRSELWSIY